MKIKYQLLHITTMLKRMKYLRLAAQILMWVIGSPFILLYCLGKAGEFCYQLLEHIYDSLEKFIVKTLNWNEVARNQYKKNPDKFK